MQSYHSLIEPFLTDLYSSETGFYSLRKLSRTQTNTIKVRRSSDNVEQDIPFRLNSIDESELTSFVGANNGFVVTQYRQDASGNDATNTTAAQQPKIVSSGTLIKTDGKIGILYDGATQWLNIPTRTITAFPFTINIWFNTADASATFRTLFTIGSSSSANEFIVVQMDSSHQLLVACRTGVAGNQHTLTGTGTWNDGNWHMVTAVAVNYGNLALYVDGQSIGTSTATNRPFPTTNQQAIGVLYRNTLGNYFPGYINDLQTFNVAFTAAQVNQLYNRMKGFYK